MAFVKRTNVLLKAFKVPSFNTIQNLNAHFAEPQSLKLKTVIKYFEAPAWFTDFITTSAKKTSPVSTRYHRTVWYGTAGDGFLLFSLRTLFPCFPERRSRKWAVVLSRDQWSFKIKTKAYFVLTSQGLFVTTHIYITVERRRLKSGAVSDKRRCCGEVATLLTLCCASLYLAVARVTTEKQRWSWFSWEFHLIGVKRSGLLSFMTLLLQHADSSSRYRVQAQV